MYIYYVLRGTQGEQQVELEGDLSEELFPGLDLQNGPAIIDHLVSRGKEEGSRNVEWSECDLTDSFFDQDDNYIFFNGRWIRRSDAPWRKDRSN
ncbi:hypothetical protein EPA93_20775 [Ktedonosporobacter rubrisoli]|uniref:Uncharacterized protein n=1 Tax=Ktedonosporobacter rubrisoli TaxID=2509675 RepID=A0A4V0YZ31_KTERU|nr:hypothetical protein [Ktedonosporobacter rubrisoli]QBD78301.1 hypothetical protein EPA93_20775 [Ktedonosporobacter rubrisoli]